VKERDPEPRWLVQKGIRYCEVFAGQDRRERICDASLLTREVDKVNNSRRWDWVPTAAGSKQK
jgi:hypothetical protein